MIRAHTKAILTALAVDPRLVVFEPGKVPATPPPAYVVLYVDSGLATTERLSHTSNRRDFEFQVTAVAVDAVGAQVTAERVMAALLDKRLTVAGRSTWPIRHMASQPVREDYDAPTRTFFATDQFRLASNPS